MSTTTVYKTFNSGDVLTAADLNSSFDQLLTGGINSINNANIAAAAAIAYSKLNLTSNIVNADISASAAIAASKIAFGDNAPDIDPKVRVYLGSSQNNIADSTATKVLLDTEDYDAGSDFASYRFTAPTTGYYLVIGSVTYNEVIAEKRYLSLVYVNNAVRLTGCIHSGTVGSPNAIIVTVSDVLSLTAGDYVELFAQHQGGAATVDVLTGQDSTFLTVHLLSI